jgi:hypothetical protein
MVLHDLILGVVLRAGKAGNAKGHAIQEEWMAVMEWRISGLCSYREIPGGGCDKMIKERIPHGLQGLTESLRALGALKSGERGGGRGREEGMRMQNGAPLCKAQSWLN